MKKEHKSDKSSKTVTCSRCGVQIDLNEDVYSFDKNYNYFCVNCRKYLVCGGCK